MRYCKMVFMLTFFKLSKSLRINLFPFVYGEVSFLFDEDYSRTSFEVF